MQCRVGFLETFLEIDLRRRQGQVSWRAPYTFIPTRARETHEDRLFEGAVQGGVYGRGVGLLAAVATRAMGVQERASVPLSHDFTMSPTWPMD